MTDDTITVSLYFNEHAQQIGIYLASIFGINIWQYIKLF